MDQDAFVKVNPVAFLEILCNECGGTIYPGERYEYVRGLWDPEVGHERFRTCRTCIATRDKLEKACVGWFYGSVLYGWMKHCLDNQGGKKGAA